MCSFLLCTRFWVRATGGGSTRSKLHRSCKRRLTCSDKMERQVSTANLSLSRSLSPHLSPTAPFPRFSSRPPTCPFACSFALPPFCRPAAHLSSAHPSVRRPAVYLFACLSTLVCPSCLSVHLRAHLPVRPSAHILALTCPHMHVRRSALTPFYLRMHVFVHAHLRVRQSVRLMPVHAHLSIYRQILHPYVCVC